MSLLFRITFCASLACALCACASDGDYRSSFYVNGAPTAAMDLRNPRFYMDERETAPVLANPALFMRPADAGCPRACGLNPWETR